MSFEWLSERFKVNIKRETKICLHSEYSSKCQKFFDFLIVSELMVQYIRGSESEFQQKLAVTRKVMFKIIESMLSSLPAHTYRL